MEWIAPIRPSGEDGAEGKDTSGEPKLNHPNALSPVGEVSPPSSPHARPKNAPQQNKTKLARLLLLLLPTVPPCH